MSWRALAAFVLLAILKLSSQAQGQTRLFTCETLDLNHTNPPQCNLPHLDVSQAQAGYVSATGKWTPGFMDNADVEFTCVRAYAPQLSDSKLGYCLMASAVVLHNMPTVSTSYYSVTSWGNTRIIAGRSQAWEMSACESQVLVIDFRFNTITLTSTLNRSEARCRKRFEAMEKGLEKPLPDNEVFSLVHSYGSFYVEGDNVKTYNPFFRP
jgi:hypothetical protein